MSRTRLAPTDGRLLRKPPGVREFKSPPRHHLPLHLIVDMSSFPMPGPSQFRVVRLGFDHEFT